MNVTQHFLSAAVNTLAPTECCQWLHNHIRCLEITGVVYRVDLRDPANVSMTIEHLQSIKRVSRDTVTGVVRLMETDMGRWEREWQMPNENYCRITASQLYVFVHQ